MGWYLPAYIYDVTMAGNLLGYIGYDMIHYFLHHAQPAPGYWKDLKIYHMEHHYKDGESGFGVSSWFWDWVFGTMIE
jgi:4-hydroxysphinganine ceramide fatty acyl 2-hydroxylase